jgi:hypothetical protein
MLIIPWKLSLGLRIPNTIDVPKIIRAVVANAEDYPIDGVSGIAVLPRGIVRYDIIAHYSAKADSFDKINSLILNLHKEIENEIRYEIEQNSDKIKQSESVKIEIPSSSIANKKELCKIPECHKPIPLKRLLRNAIYCSDKCRKTAANRRIKEKK